MIVQLVMVQLLILAEQVELIQLCLTQPGQDYKLGDNIVIRGQQLGGADTTHDLRIIVTGIDTGGELQTFDDEGAAFDGNGTFQT